MDNQNMHDEALARLIAEQEADDGGSDGLTQAERTDEMVVDKHTRLALEESRRETSQRPPRDDYNRACNELAGWGADDWND